MIAASRRRRPGVISADEAFRLHLRIARRATWSTRLMRASLLTLAASVVALFAGAELTTHLIACAAAFVIGLAMPVRGSLGAALAEIRSVAGLSYETALGLFALEAAPPTGASLATRRTTSASDAYGFREAVIDRARLTISDIRPASPPAWWLPALAVAIALLLFGVLERPFANGGVSLGGLGGPDGGGVSAPPAAGEDLAAEGEEPEVVPPEPEAGRAEEPEGADATPPGENQDSPAVAPPAEGGDAAAPMSRFLDSLRERPPEQAGGAPERPEAGQAGDEPEGAGDQQSGGAPGEREGESERAEVQDSGSPSGAASEAEAQGEQGEGEGAGESGDQEAADGEGGEEPGQDGAQEQAGGGEEQPQGGQGEAPAGQSGDEVDQGESEFQAGGAEGDSTDPLDAGGAGAGAGVEQEAGVAEGEAATPDFLQGVLEDGPENPAGTVRLPGDQEVALPPGRSAADYQSAAEEAITEGDLPLSYQDIIRRYFQ